MSLWGASVGRRGRYLPGWLRLSDQIVFPEFFAANPDSKVSKYQTPNGIYEPHCGLDKVYMSWGHDEYIYNVTRNYLPEPAQYMLRYHSFYAAHRHGAYRNLMNQHDEEMFEWVKKFNPYDLYSKGADRPDLEKDQAILRRPDRRVFPSADRLVTPRSLRPPAPGSCG